jgi:anti-sigma B factor antagonist
MPGGTSGGGLLSRVGGCQAGAPGGAGDMRDRGKESMDAQHGDQRRAAPAAGFRFWSAAGLPVVTPPEEIDEGNAEQLRSALAVAGGARGTVVADLRANVFCDSCGLRTLLLAARHARAAGGELRVVMGHASIRRVFKVTGLDRHLSLFTTLEDATAPAPGHPDDTGPPDSRDARD